MQKVQSYIQEDVTLAGSSKPGYKLTRVVNSIVSSFDLLVGGIQVVTKSKAIDGGMRTQSNKSIDSKTLIRWSFYI